MWTASVLVMPMALLWYWRLQLARWLDEDHRPHGGRQPFHQWHWLLCTGMHARLCSIGHSHFNPFENAHWIHRKTKNADNATRGFANTVCHVWCDTSAWVQWTKQWTKKGFCSISVITIVLTAAMYAVSAVSRTLPLVVYYLSSCRSCSYFDAILVCIEIIGSQHVATKLLWVLPLRSTYLRCQHRCFHHRICYMSTCCCRYFL